MSSRLNILKESPEAYKAMRGLEVFITQSGLNRNLYELIKLRASQINGCAYCINMHTRDAIKMGETTQRLFLLDAWRETELYSEKERAALALTESMTLISRKHVTDEVYEQAEKHFDKEELAAVIMAVVTINSWNRIAITSQSELD